MDFSRNNIRKSQENHQQNLINKDKKTCCSWEKLNVLRHKFKRCILQKSFQRKPERKCIRMIVAILKSSTVKFLVWPDQFFRASTSALCVFVNLLIKIQPQIAKVAKIQKNGGLLVKKSSKACIKSVFAKLHQNTISVL